VLIAGCTGLAAEVAKNIVLAGVGSVTLVDDTPCSSRPPSNFLIPADTPDNTTCVLSWHSIVAVLCCYSFISPVLC